jgi:hypothetical protein
MNFNPREDVNPQSKRLERLFFAHPEAVELWKQHPDVILMDCTYKTNRFRMPLLNICAVTGSKKTIQIALCFLSGEKEGSYQWAMECLQELQEKMGISAPVLIVTDRETALMKALDSVFPESVHLLCTWHVNMNILANCRKHFPKDQLGETGTDVVHPMWAEFLKDWASLMDAATEAEYTLHLIQFRTHSKAATAYVEATWLKWKEKLIRYWVDSNLHFGVRVTSPIEGCHAVLKSYLKVSTGDLKGVFDRLQLFWPNQHRNIHDAAAQEQNKIKHRLNKPYFHLVQGLVYDKALILILRECVKLYKAKEEASSREQRPATRADLGLCICTIKASMGIPCFHTIFDRLTGNGHILPEDIHPFWWYKRPEQGTTSEIAVQTAGVVLNPAVVRGKGRPKGAKGRKSKSHGTTCMSPASTSFTDI